MTPDDVRGLLHIASADPARHRVIQSILTLGVEVLGSVDALAAWLSRRNPALGGAVPSGMLDTADGAREVEAVLGRALLGGYS